MEGFFAGIWEFVTDWLWPLVQFLIGLNVVVFVHELGHYLAARWAGIKVEKFALGMGPRVVGFVKGDTDYCLCAFPIGGYVKMLGQDDFAPQDEQQKPDPRSYNAQPVGKRLVVIAAGVCMNVVLAAVLFIVVAMVGMDFPAPIVGQTQPNYPASRTHIEWADQAPPKPADAGEDFTWRGLEPGDRITAINDSKVTRFADLLMKATLASPGEEFEVTFQRRVEGKTYTGRAKMTVRMNEQMGAPQFGLAPAYSLTVADIDGRLEDTPFRAGDKVVAIDGRAIEHHWQLKEIAETLDGSEVEVTVLRDGQEVTFTRRPVLRLKPDVIYLEDGDRKEGQVVVNDLEEKVKFSTMDGEKREIAAEHIAIEQENGELLILHKDLVSGGGYWNLLDVLGLIPRMKITGVLEDSPAEEAGLLPGDIVQSYGDEPTPSVREFREISERVQGSGAETSITVLRNGHSKLLSVEPGRKNGEALIGVRQSVDLLHSVVASVREGSAADKAGIAPEGEIVAVNDMPVTNWYDFYERLKSLDAEAPVELSIRIGDTTEVYEIGPLSETTFRSGDYEFILLGNVPFKRETVRIRHTNPLRAIAWGGEEAYRLVISSYQSILSMIRGTVSASKQARGPVGIGQMAMDVARKGFIDLVYMMAFLSAAVAVFNFLPLPVLDGGHAVLLIIEKIRGKPLPVKVVNIIQMTGLVLILGLAVLLTWSDIARIIRGMY